MQGTPNRSRKRQKHSRIEALDARQFLSLEAEVDDDDQSGVDEEDGEFDDFIDELEPIAADRGVSHHLLLLENARVNDESEWESLLARARSRGRNTIEAHQTNEMHPPIPTDVNICLWRVSVKPGLEETTAFLLMEKIIRGGEGCWGVKTVIGRVSRPGWMVIEASTIRDVQMLCQGVSNIFWQKIHVVEPEDAPSCLKEAKSYTPPKQSWVRLTRHPHKGDLAYVKDFDVWGADVLVVPRLNYDRHRRTSAQLGKRKRSSRPEQALFDGNRVKAIWGDGAVEQRNHRMFLFKGDFYQDGYRCLLTDDFYPEEAIPTSEEVALFKDLQIIPQEFFQRTLELMGARRLCVGDPAKVVEGEAQGAVGVVKSIVDNEVVLRISPGNLELSLSINALRKNISVGDEVIVAMGPQTGVTGWVISMTGEMLLLYDHKTAREVIVPSHCVNFSDVPFIMKSVPYDLAPAPIEFHSSPLEEVSDPVRSLIGRPVRIVKGHLKGFQGVIKSHEGRRHVLVELYGSMQLERLEVLHVVFLGPGLDDIPHVENSPYSLKSASGGSRLGEDPNYGLLGRHVRVIKNNRLKDYEGIIKLTQGDNYVLVEIQATMHQERLHLSNLTFLNDGWYTPLGLSRTPDKTNQIASSSNHQRMPEIPKSALPLVPSTPLPGTSDMVFSPAWDPSSRAPNPLTAFPYTPWMELSIFCGKRIKVQVKNTKAVLRDSGWKNGDYEDRIGIWTGIEGSMAKVLLGLNSTISIPAIYVRHVRPSIKGQNVVVLEGDLMGIEYCIMTFGAAECVARRRHGKVDPKSSKVVISTNILAVVS